MCWLCVIFKERKFNVFVANKWILSKQFSMSKFTKTEEGTHQHSQSGFGQRFSNLRIFTYLALIGITMAFLALTVSYLAATIYTPFNKLQLPYIFHANTVIILFSSYAVHQMRKAAQANDFDILFTGLVATAGLGIAFTVFQLMGWAELSAQSIGLHNLAGAHLYVITGLHLLHLSVGVVLLAFTAYHAWLMKTDAVKQLLFETDPMSKERIDMLATYWHFVDGLWVYLYLFFIMMVNVIR